MAFESKTDLFWYYEQNMGAIRLDNSLRMVIEMDSATELVQHFIKGRYFLKNIENPLVMPKLVLFLSF